MGKKKYDALHRWRVTLVKGVPVKVEPVEKMGLVVHRPNGLLSRNFRERPRQNEYIVCAQDELGAFMEVNKLRMKQAEGSENPWANDSIFD